MDQRRERMVESYGSPQVAIPLSSLRYDSAISRITRRFIESVNAGLEGEGYVEGKGAV
jgi:hypothetical protein